MFRDPVDIEARQAELRALEEDSDRERRRTLDDLRRVMSGEHGRRTIYRLIEGAGVFHSSFLAGDPYGTSFNEGGRNVGLRWLKLVEEAAPEHWEAARREVIESRILEEAKA